MTVRLDIGVTHAQRNPSYVDSLGKSFVGSVVQSDDTTPSETVVYPSRDRRLLLVEPRTMLVVTGYNLTKNTQVIFRKVLRSNGVPAHGTGDCCPSVTVSHSVRLHSAELPCWTLSKDSPIFIIKIAGSYEIDVTGDNADVVITAMAYPMQEHNAIAECCCLEGGE